MEQQKETIDLHSGILVDYAISCSDYHILRDVIFNSGHNGTNLFPSKTKDAVVNELDQVRSDIDVFAKEEEANLKKQMISESGSSPRDMYSLLYHKIASRSEHELQKFQLKYPQANLLVKAKLKDMQAQLQHLEKRVEMFESFGKRRKSVISESFLYNEENEWSPYEETFAYIWSKHVKSDEDEVMRERETGRKNAKPNSRNSVDKGKQNKRKKQAESTPKPQKQQKEKEEVEISFAADDLNLLDRKKIVKRS